MALFSLKRNDASFHTTFLVSFKTKTDVESQENIAVLLRAKSEKNSGWSSKNWNTKANWQRSAVEDASSERSSKLAKWKENSHNGVELGMLVYEKETLGSKVARRAQKKKRCGRCIGRCGDSGKQRNNSAKSGKKKERQKSSRKKCSKTWTRHRSERVNRSGVLHGA